MPTSTSPLQGMPRSRKPRRDLIRIVNLLWHRLEHDVIENRKRRAAQDTQAFSWSIRRQTAHAEMQALVERILDLFENNGIEPPLEDARCPERKEENYSPLDRLYDTAYELRNCLDEAGLRQKRITTFLRLESCKDVLADAKQCLTAFNDESFFQEYHARRTAQVWRIDPDGPSRLVLKPCWREALRQFSLAVTGLGWEDGEKLPSDKEAYAWLRKADQVLPEFRTWSRYLREYRKAKDLQKYTRRAERVPSRSVASKQNL